MSEHAARTFGSDFKRFFLRGLVVLLPTVLTLWIVVKAYQFIDSAIAEPINQGLRLAIAKATPGLPVMQMWFDPSDEAVDREMQDMVLAAGLAPDREATRAELRSRNIDEWWAGTWYMDFVGLIVAIVAVYTAGRLLGGYIGRFFSVGFERLLTRIPVFKQVYPYVKQIVDFLFSDDKSMKFNKVVAVEYPRRGIWSVGFLTGHGMAATAEQRGRMATVFMPSSPTPFTGYTVTVPAEDVIDLPLTVEEALRFLVSGGVLEPGHLPGGAATVPRLAPARVREEDLVGAGPQERSGS